MSAGPAAYYLTSHWPRYQMNTGADVKYDIEIEAGALRAARIKRVSISLGRKQASLVRDPAGSTFGLMASTDEADFPAQAARLLRELLADPHFLAAEHSFFALRNGMPAADLLIDELKDIPGTSI